MGPQLRAVAEVGAFFFFEVSFFCMAGMGGMVGGVDGCAGPRPMHFFVRAIRRNWQNFDSDRDGEAFFDPLLPPFRRKPSPSVLVDPCRLSSRASAGPGPGPSATASAVSRVPPHAPESMVECRIGGAARAGRPS